MRGMLEMKNDRLRGLVADVASASGVSLFLHPVGRVVYGVYESQAMSRRVRRLDVVNAHGEQEVLIEGSEAEVFAALTAAKRILDIQLQLRFKM